RNSVSTAKASAAAKRPASSVRSSWVVMMGCNAFNDDLYNRASLAYRNRIADLTEMKELVRLFAQIALMRKGPQDLPASAALLVATAAAFFIVNCLVSAALPPIPG